MFFLTLSLTFCCAFLTFSVHGSELNGKIIGGESTTIDRYPYQASINYNEKHECGGSIISAKWIVTGAHCVYWKEIKRLSVRAGSNYSSKGGQLKTVFRAISHERYDEDTYDYDVALIEVSSAFKLSPTVKVMKLASLTTKVPASAKLVVTGWGKTSLSGSMSNTLQTLALPSFDQEKCRKIYLYHNYVTQRMLCAGYTTGGKDTCHGDSGGPLVYNGVQVGIVSWGALCAKPGYPGVYTRVSEVRSWITKHAKV